MSFIQVTYYVPPKIYKELMSGTLTRHGDMIRDSTRIIAHLKEVPLTKEVVNSSKSQGSVLTKMQKTLESIVNNVIRIFEKGGKNKYVLIGSGILVAAGVTGGTIAFANSRKKRKIREAEIEACAERHNKALSEYLNAINQGNLQISIVKNLIDSLNGIKEKLENKEAELSASSKELLFILRDYTQKLATANGIALNELDVAEDESIISLLPYLEKQKEIMESAL